MKKKLLPSDRDRLVNCTVDFFFILVTILVFTLLTVITDIFFRLDIFTILEEIMIDLGYAGTYFSFAMIYYLVLESCFGRTIGKFITGSVVVNENGLKPDFATICKRTLCRLIPFDVLSFLDKSGRFWHDSLSKSYVVVKCDLEKDMEIFYGVEKIGINEVD